MYTVGAVGVASVSVGSTTAGAVRGRHPAVGRDEGFLASIESTHRFSLLSPLFDQRRHHGNDEGDRGDMWACSYVSSRFINTRPTA